MMSKYDTKEIYVSIDIEADGPIPGQNSMLSFAAAAFDLSSLSPRVPVTTFQANLDLLPGTVPSESTMNWWATQPDAWAACRKDIRFASDVMPEFITWCRKLHGKPVIVGYPVTFDFMFLHWYVMAFGGLKDGEMSPCGFQGLDIKTLAAERMSCAYRHATKKRMPKHWFDGAPRHTHCALDDAIGQGVLFVNIVNDKGN